MKTSSIFISALEDLYYSLTSPNLVKNLDDASLSLLSNWNFSQIIRQSYRYSLPHRKILFLNDPCLQKWNGILCKCSKDDCKIWSIDVEVRHSSINLAAINNTTIIYSSIPSSISYFLDLEYLSIHSDILFGSIPIELGFLTSLKYLNLSGNNLSGSLLDSFRLFGNLSNLYLNDNHFTGSIPISYFSIGKLISNGELISIDLSNNLLSGSIPFEMFNISYLSSISLSNNLLTGNLFFHGDLISSTLKDIVLSNNFLSGTLPASILNSSTLYNIVLSYNQFSGSISNNIFPSKTQIQYIDLSHNILTNSIPPQLSNLSSLMTLNLGYNYFTATIPFQFQILNGSLQSLDLSNNQLSSTIPSELGALFGLATNSTPILYYMNLNNNILTGNIPSTLGSMSGVNYLDLSDNLLYGRIPSDLSNLANLKELYLQSNLFTGTIDGLLDASRQNYFHTLDISSNYLTGSIPSSLFTIPSLSRFIANKNCISGDLPYEICNANNLTVLMLSGLSSASICTNTINSKYVKASYYTLKFALESIPSCVYSLLNLNILEISGNKISEKLRDGMIIGSNLRQLQLSHNQYSGSIPSEIQMRQWQKLDLSSNKINGILSRNFFKINSTGSNVNNYYNKEQLQLSMNRLSGFIPNSIKNIGNISILHGNMFQCDYFHTSLPTADNEKYSYSCGSESVDYILYSWIFLSVMLGLFVYFISRIPPPKKVDRRKFVKKSKKSLKTIFLDFFSNFKSEYDLSIASFEEELSALPERQNRYIIMTGRFLKRLRKLLMWLIIYVTVLVLPIYCILNIYYRNYTQMYLWTVSALFLSGLYPGVMIFLLSVVTLILITFLYNVYIFTLDDFLIAVDSEDINGREKIKSTESYCSQAINILMKIIFSIINMALMLSVNIGFVYGSINLSRYFLIILELALVVFTLFWNDKVLGSMIQCIINRKPIFLQNNYRPEMFYLFHVLFNVIIAPCLAVGLVSDECMYYAIFPFPVISSSYMVSHPIYGFKAFQSVLIDSQIIINQSYIPPYSYNFQCGSTFVTTYCSVFIFMFIISVFGVPLRDFITKCFYQCIPLNYKWKVYLENMLPNIKRPLNILVAGESFVNSELILFDKYKFARNISCFITILITFGTIFPPLGIISYFSIIVKIKSEQYIIGKFLHMADKEGLLMHRNILDYQCKDLAETFSNSLYIILPVSSLFYALFIYDTIAAGSNSSNALPAVVLMFCTPIVLYIISILKNLCLPNYAKVYAESQAQLLKVQLTYQLNLEYTPQSNVDSNAVMLEARNNRYSYHSTSLILEEFDNNDDLSLYSSQSKSIYSIKRKPDLIDFEHYVN